MLSNQVDTQKTGQYPHRLGDGGPEQPITNRGNSNRACFGYSRASSLASEPSPMLPTPDAAQKQLPASGSSFTECKLDPSHEQQLSKQPVDSRPESFNHRYSPDDGYLKQPISFHVDNPKLRQSLINVADVFIPKYLRYVDAFLNDPPRGYNNPFEMMTHLIMKNSGNESPLTLMSLNAHFKLLKICSAEKACLSELDTTRYERIFKTENNDLSYMLSKTLDEIKNNKDQKYQDAVLHLLGMALKARKCIFIELMFHAAYDKNDGDATIKKFQRFYKLTTRDHVEDRNRSLDDKQRLLVKDFYEKMLNDNKPFKDVFNIIYFDARYKAMPNNLIKVLTGEESACTAGFKQ